MTLAEKPGTTERPWRSRIVGHADVPPLDLVPNPENWRSHPQAQRDALGGALEDVGWVTEVIVNQTTGHLVDGHLRLDLALSRNEPFVPVTYVELTQDEERLVLATLDPLAAMADAEVIPLQELLAQLDPNNAALRGVLANLGEQYDTKRPGLVDPDDAPPLGEETNIKRGDLFALGDHRLMCGDATDAGDVGRLMDGAQADLVWTDPPYGVTVASRIGTRGVSSAEARGLGTLQLENDSLAVGPLTDLLRSAFKVVVAVTKPGAGWYVTAPHGPIGLAFSIVLAELDVWRNSIVWIKDSLVMGRADYHYRHEPIYYGWTPGAGHHKLTDRAQDTVWEFPRPKRSLDHPTMKPVALVERAITNSTNPGAVVVDTFLGSGTTIIAAEQLGRRCYAMEIDPRYVAVAIKRWEDFTGKTAEQQA